MFSIENDPKARIDNAYKEGREAGLEQGYAHGFSQGMERGRNQVFYLYEKLLEENRMKDWEKALSDEACRNALIEEYKLG